MLEFRVALNGQVRTEELKTGIEEQIRIQQPGMWANLQCSMYRVDVSPMAPEQFPQTRKVRLLVDER